ncbi:pLS20_p028 family conjugation system transmembrane protein [Emergencia sp. 1XD21-10]|uniref:pLS20_p028 family conjugation system transmembrane protein n=1 Tax=Emergencia sp. 1XD21-10 TaxID=2304569 RepID=UPI00137ACE05|nr:hypothetical protein [Emergencia sp. 1XD21-10]NCE98115.1 hypothetical protein [Emergencia sp. 1XD21-10]
MSKTELIDFFLHNAELFYGNNIIVSGLRTIGWFLFKLIVTLTDACQQLYDITFGLVDISTWDKVNTFVDSFKPLFIALMAVSLFALGIMLMFNHEKKPKIIINICIACLCVTCSTLVFQQMNNIAVDLKQGIDTVSEDVADTGVYSMVSSHFYDIYYLDQKLGMSAINYQDNRNNLPHATLNKEKLNIIDYAEVLDPDDDLYEFSDENAKDILSKKLTTGGDGESYGLKEIYNGVAWTDVGNNFYYRYKMDFLPALLQLISLAIIYIALSYKCVRIEFELLFARLAAYLYSAELSGGQKIARILVFIRDSYITLLMTTVCLKLFYMMQAFVEAKVDNSLTSAIIGIFIALSVIDGPNLVEKLLGMDVGLQSSVGRMIAAYKFGSAAAHGGRSILRGASHAASAAGHIGAAAGRKGKEIYDTHKNGAPDAAGTDTSFMDNDTSNNAENNGINGEHKADGKGSEQENMAAAAGMGAVAGAAAVKGDEKGIPQSDAGFTDTSFMDDDDKDKEDTHGLHGENQPEVQNAAFMEDNPQARDEDHVNPADRSDEQIGKDTAFMENAAVENPIEDTDKKSVQQSGESGFAEMESKDAHTAKPGKDSRNTSLNQEDRQEDRWDKLMQEKQFEQRESSLRTSKPQYKGSILHRMPADDNKEDGDKKMNMGKENDKI